MEPETCTNNLSSNVGVNYCPVCQQEYIEGEKNNCPTCGWDITPYPQASQDQTPEAFVQKEQSKLDWAKQVWARLKLQEEQVKQILAIFHTQSNAISSLREKSNQEQLAELAALFKEQKQQWQHEIAASQSQLAEILTTQKQQWQHEVTASQSQLAEILTTQKQQWQYEITASQSQLAEILTTQKQQWQHEMTDVQAQLREILAQIKQNNQLPRLAEDSSDDLSSEEEEDDTLGEDSSDDLSLLEKAMYYTLLEDSSDDLSSEEEDDTLGEDSSDDLSSEVGVDYTQLRNLLRDGEWQEADEETYHTMLVVSKRKKERYLGKEDIAKFPCTDLRTIDQLWVKYSSENFGFSVQKEIWLGVGGRLRGGILDEYRDRDRDRIVWELFCNRVGWCVGDVWLNYSKCTFSADAPIGHLPYFPYLNFENRRSSGLQQRKLLCLQSVFFSRVKTCIL